MIPRHIDCGTTITFKPVIDDGGACVLVLWCPACAIALGIGEYDGTVDVADVPADAIAVCLADRGRVQ